MKNNKRKIGILGVMLASSALMLASCQFNQTEEKPYSIGENGFITLDHASGISENGELNLDKIDGYTISAVADEAYKVFNIQIAEMILDLLERVFGIESPFVERHPKIA